MSDEFPFVVVVPPEHRGDKTMMQELERNFGVVGAQWYDRGDAICFRDQADADALAIVFRQYSPPVD